MKGVILAGGTASRLLPLTRVTNKHLLPVYDKPMIFYPIETLRGAGIKDILIITSPHHGGAIFSLLGSGREFGVNLTYKIQDEPSGIPSAIGLAREFVGNDKFVVINGDNILTHSIEKHVKTFDESGDDAKILLFQGTLEQAKKSGIAIIKNGKVEKLMEKPREPIGTMISIGVNMYRSIVFDIIETLKPSARGETEITELNSYFLSRGKLGAGIIDGHWLDAGTVEELLEANIKMKEFNLR
jgi:glucose-1-phosphate thymidylyltransferase